MKGKLLSLLLISYCLFLIARPAHADYVLPYPSYMPGNKLYAVSRMIDKVKAYWYFGSIAQAKYHLLLSDKYFVEAKTLFEYNQYVLALDALARSDEHFVKIFPSIQKAEKEQKQMSSFYQIYKEASGVHTAILKKILESTPEVFTWRPEKQEATELQIQKALETSINKRIVLQ